MHHHWIDRKTASSTVLYNAGKEQHSASGETTPSPRRLSPNKRTSLRWVVQSVERMLKEEDGVDAVNSPSPALISALKQLERAHTQREVAEAGRALERVLSDSHQESMDVQDRVIKATSMAGLLSLSTALATSMIQRGRLPSNIAYTAVCRALRQARKLNQLEAFLRLLGTVKTETVSCDALTLYLSALSDEIEHQAKQETRNKRRPQNKRSYSRQERGPSREDLLNTALLWLEREAELVLRIQPDCASYATVLKAAATAGNSSLARLIWNQQLDRGVTPNSYSYNSYLKAIQVGSQDQATSDREILSIMKTMTEVHMIPPNRYTIDLLALPMARTGLKDEWTKMVDDFFLQNVNDTGLIADTFAALLITLVKGGQLETARNIFDFYLLPSLPRQQPKVQVVHFNILIDGYRREFNKQGRIPNREERTDLDLGGMSLYRTLVKSELRPDAFTLTSILGLVSSSKILSRILRAAILKYNIDVTPAVLRAALTTCGDCMDPSSACWLFDTFFTKDFESTRTLNVLLGALAKGSTSSRGTTLLISESVAAREFEKVGSLPKKGNFPLSSELQGMESPQAAMRVLEFMRSNSEDKFFQPDSQTFCHVASAVQHLPASSNAEAATALYWQALEANITFDGRFVNALFLCFGGDIQEALRLWKRGIRQACLQHSNWNKSTRYTTKNLQAAYHGLLHVCGRALRPDIALRLVFAMGKEEVPINEMALKCYLAGKRRRPDGGNIINSRVLNQQFENLLTIECTRYDVNDKRREGEKRVRIIL